MELDGVREQQVLGNFVHGVETAVLVEDGANVETVVRPKVLGLVIIGIVMDENLAAEWVKWGGIVDMGIIEVFPIGDGWIERGLTEEVEGHIGLDKEEIPNIFWKSGIDAGEYGQEVGFEGLDSSFSGVATVDVRGNEL